LGTSINSTSSSASSTSPAKQVAYCGIDVYCSAVLGSLSYDKSRTLKTIPSALYVEPDDDESVASPPVSCSGNVAVNTGNSLSIVPQSERETQEFGV